MVLLEFSMTPLHKGESLSPYVARVLDTVDKSGLPYQLTAMGTILEGEYDAVMNVVRECFVNLKQDCSRISVSLKLDYREGTKSRFKLKTDKLESILGRKLNK